MEEFSQASSLVLFDDFCVQSGLDPQRMLAQAGLPVDVLAHPESFISPQKIALLLNDCARTSGNSLFGLELALYQGTEVLGPLLYLLKNAGTVGESLRELTRYYHLHTSSGAVKLAIEDQLALLEYQPLLREGAPARQLLELTMGGGRRLLKMLLGSRWQPKALYLQTAAGASVQTYTRLFGIAPQFNSDRNAWVFDAALLDAPLTDADPRLHSLMRCHIDRMDQLAPKDLPAFVSQLLGTFLPNGKVTIDQVADFMLLSPRSLQRLLLEAGTSFQVLLAETRKAAAARYLQESDMSLTQIAGLLGYADLSSFSRAFQGWFGASPRQWRAVHGRADSPSTQTGLSRRR